MAAAMSDYAACGTTTSYSSYWLFYCRAITVDVRAIIDL